MQNMKKEKALKLRNKAEEMLKKQRSKESLSFSEINLLKLVHELQVHQIELEVQNEELALARKQEESVKNKYTILFEFAPSAYFVLTPNGNIAEVNLAGEKMLGKDRRKLINNRLALYISSGTRGVFADFLSKVVSTKYTEHCDVIFESHDGTLIHARLSSSLNTDGNLFLIHAEDVTDRKRSELLMQIHYSIAHSVQVTDSIEQLLEIIRAELGRLLDTSNFFAAIYDAKNDMLSKLIYRDEKDEFTEWPANRALSGHVVKSGKTLLLKSHDIESFARDNNIELMGRPPACWLGAPFIIRNKIAGIMVVQSYDNPEAYTTADVALFEMVAQEAGTYIEKQQMLKDLVEAKESAQQSDRLKSAFLANMSHEIRTPMNGILGFTDLLKEPKLNNARQKKYIEIIEKSGFRMLNIINDIIDLSKIEAGMMEMDLVESDINQQLDYIHTFFKPEVEAKRMKFFFKNPSPMKKVIVKTDREKLFAILSNLVKNAIRYSDEGVIEIGYEINSGVIEFFVKDTGIGIPKERQEAIFERFIQSDIEDRAARQGSGLGLAISRSYIEMLGGEIWVESKEGIGSTFFFTLPYNSESVTAKKQDFRK